MNDLLARFMTFDKLIATGLIKVLYWVGIAVIALGALLAAFGGFSQGFMAGLGSLVLAPIVAAIGIVFWRFLCELYIAIFGMYNRLGEISEKLDRR
ncbi:MAG: DUF4282 domain-containing protein [Pseudomonadota bacterium]